MPCEISWRQHGCKRNSVSYNDIGVARKLGLRAFQVRQCRCKRGNTGLNAGCGLDLEEYAVLVHMTSSGIFAYCESGWLLRKAVAGRVYWIHMFGQSEKYIQNIFWSGGNFLYNSIDYIFSLFLILYIGTIHHRLTALSFCLAFRKFLERCFYCELKVFKY